MVSNQENAERIVEALLFTSKEPIFIKEIKKMLPENVDVEATIKVLQERYSTRGINVKRFGSSVVLRTAKDLNFLFTIKQVKRRSISRAAKETLAIIAYHQPVTKLEIEEIRGVSVGSGTIDLLFDLEWVKFGQRKSSPGRPITFKVTEKFLDHFDLESTKDLPGIKEIQDLGLSVKKLNK